MQSKVFIATQRGNLAWRHFINRCLSQDKLLLRHSEGVYFYFKPCQGLWKDRNHIRTCALLSRAGNHFNCHCSNTALSLCLLFFRNLILIKNNTPGSSSALEERMRDCVQKSQFMKSNTEFCCTIAVPCSCSHSKAPTCSSKLQLHHLFLNCCCQHSAFSSAQHRLQVNGDFLAGLLHAHSSDTCMEDTSHPSEASLERPPITIVTENQLL